MTPQPPARPDVDLATADLDRIEADANSPGVDTWGDEHCVMRVSEVNALLSMARQVATIRDETLEAVAKLEDDRIEYLEMEIRSHRAHYCEEGPETCDEVNALDEAITAANGRARDIRALKATS